MGAIAGRGIRKGERGFICYDSAMAFPERVGEEKDLSALPCFFFFLSCKDRTGVYGVPIYEARRKIQFLLFFFLLLLFFIYFFPVG